jgi:XTP/dITP diphosphohydrolase
LNCNGRSWGARVQTVVLATANAHKVLEIERVLVGLRVLPRPDSVGEIEEGGSSFEENATTKALAVARVSALIALADDSGLVIPSLGGAPGVTSARFAGPNATDLENITKVLTLMQGLDDRAAYFVSVIALARPDGRVVTFEGCIEGYISEEIRGDGGFGYDPIFVPNTGDGRSFAELTMEEKNRVSHRAVAISKVVEFVNSPEGLEFFHL